MDLATAGPALGQFPAVPAPPTQVQKLTTTAKDLTDILNRYPDPFSYLLPADSPYKTLKGDLDLTLQSLHTALQNKNPAEELKVQHTTSRVGPDGKVVYELKEENLTDKAKALLQSITPPQQPQTEELFAPRKNFYNPYQQLLVPPPVP